MGFSTSRVETPGVSKILFLILLSIGGESNKSYITSAGRASLQIVLSPFYWCIKNHNHFSGSVSAADFHFCMDGDLETTSSNAGIQGAPCHQVIHQRALAKSFHAARQIPARQKQSTTLRRNGGCRGHLSCLLWEVSRHPAAGFSPN